MTGWTIRPAIRAGKPFSRWCCVLAAAVCAALASPALGRADTPGLGDAAAQVDAALAQVDAVAPGTAAGVQPVVDQAFASASAAMTAAPPAQAAAPQSNPAPAAVPPASAAAPPAAAEIVNEVVAPVEQALAPSKPAPATASRARDPKRPRTPSSLVRPAPAASAAAGSASAASATPAAAGAAYHAAALTAASAAPAGEPSNARHPKRSPASGGALPRTPVPPRHHGPGQDFTAPAQGGGQGQLAPLLVAALAAAVAFTRVSFRTRLLLRSAFRKPRRVALAVWHPG
jgi:hypothetical protein